jgi:hypothetical protein
MEEYSASFAEFEPRQACLLPSQGRRSRRTPTTSAAKPGCNIDIQRCRGLHCACSPLDATLAGYARSGFLVANSMTSQISTGVNPALLRFTRFRRVAPLSLVTKLRTVIGPGAATHVAARELARTIHWELLDCVRDGMRSLRLS